MGGHLFQARKVIGEANGLLEVTQLEGGPAGPHRSRLALGLHATAPGGPPSPEGASQQLEVAARCKPGCVVTVPGKTTLPNPIRYGWGAVVTHTHSHSCGHAHARPQAEIPPGPASQPALTAELSA